MRPAPIILAVALAALFPAAASGLSPGGHAAAPAAHPAPAPAAHPAPPPAAHPAPPPAAHAAPPPASAPPVIAPLPPPTVPVPYAASPVTAVPRPADLTLQGITTHPAPAPGTRTPPPMLAVHPAPPPNRPGQPGQGHPAPPPGAPGTPLPPPVVVPVAPYWWGWGWGWGYYPIYPAPPPDVSDLRPGGGQALTDGPRTSASLRATVATDVHGGVAGLALAVDGRSLGFQASIDAIDRSRAPATDPTGSLGTLGYGTMHATWSFLSERNVRVRLEAGASVVTLGDASGAGAPPYAGSSLVGPSFGVSGHLGLLGPVGLEGHARVTPSPVPVSDSRVALAIRGGPLAIGLGYRWLGIQGDGTSAPDLRFAGPELQIAARF